MPLQSPTLPALSFSLAKGLVTDCLPNNQPPDTYRFGRDWTLESDLTHSSLRLPQLSAQLPGQAYGLRDLNGETIVLYDATANNATGATQGGVGVLVVNGTTGVSTFTPIWEDPILELAGVCVMRARLDYRGHRLIYFTDGVNPVRKLDLDARPFPVEADDLNLILHNPLPDTPSWRELDGGALPAGMYQVLARLLTTSRTATPFNIGTPLIPLSARPSTAPWPQQDGGLDRPGSRQLQITVGGIAPGFRYVQLAVVFYDPYTLAPQVYLQDAVEIDPTQTEATLLVSKLPDTTISAAQLTTEAVNIKTVDMLTIAKESLLLSGVTVQRADGFDWQAVANQTAVYWTTTTLTTVPPKPNINGRNDVSPNVGPPPLYYDAVTAATLKSNQRGEVYSYALSPIIEGERTQAAFAIPAGVATGPNATIPWVSAERYPVNRGFPVEPGTMRPAFIRHHKMPSLSDCPLTTNGNNPTFDDGSTGVVVLGVRVELPQNLLALIPADIQKRLLGFRILRQPRPIEDSTILASGLAQTMLSYKQVLFPSPFSGYYHADDDGNLSGWSRQGTYSPDSTADHYYLVERQRLAFYSLDTLMGGVDPAAAQRIQYVGLLKGRTWLVDSKRVGDDDDKDEGSKHATSFTSLPLVDTQNVNLGASYPLDQSLTQPVSAGDPFASDVNIGDVLGSYSLRNQNGYTLLALDNTSGQYNDGFTIAGVRRDMEYSNRTGRTDEIFLFDQQDVPHTQDDIGGRLVPAVRYLTQLTRSLPAQYGRIEQASYIEVGTVAATSGASGTAFRGDVFVQPGAILLTSQERRYNYDTEDDEVNGPYTRQLVWFYCESRVNAGRRHYDAPRAGFQGTTPYYPLLKVLGNEAGTGLLQLPTAGGHAVGYNKSFSLEDRLTVFRPQLLSQDAIVERFRNRTYYTAPLVEGALTDSWQSVKADDYYDLPATHGYLTDVFVQAGIVFMRTEQTLFRAFFKETSFNITTSGQALLGTGLAFAQPAEQVLMADGGYAGGNRAGSSDTVAGRVLVDAERLQLFLFNGKLEELLRAKGCVDLLRQLLATGPVQVGAYDPTDGEKTFYVFTRTAGILFSLSGEQFVCLTSFGAEHSCTTAEHVILASGPNLYNLTFGQPSTQSALHIAAVPLGGKREAAYQTAALHGQPLPASAEFISSSNQVQARTFRLHGGLRDVYRTRAELVARRFDQHYNFDLPTDSNNAYLSGNYLVIKMEWTEPARLRSIDMWAQLNGVNQG